MGDQIDNLAARPSIHQLPTELLIDILLYSINWNSWDIRELQQRALVSRYWRDLVLNTSSFWTVLDSRSPPRVWDVILFRNPATSMEIRIWGSCSSHFISLAFLIIPRCQALSVDLSVSAEQQILAFCASCFPKLSCVDARGIGFGLQPITLDFGAGVPFRYLHIRRLSTCWGSPRLAGLLSLKLIHISDPHPTFQQLHAALSSSPQLFELSLIDSRWPEVAEADSANLGLIQLPHLVELTFQEIPSSLSNALIPRIRTSRCQRLLAQSSGLRLGRSGETIFDLARPMLQKATKLAVEKYSTVAEVFVGPSHATDRLGSSIYVDFNLEDVEFEEVLQHIGENIGSNTVVEVSIVEECSQVHNF